MTVTKMDLADNLMAQGMARDDAKSFVEHVFTEIAESLTREETVKISGFGNFEVRHKPQRPGQNFQKSSAVAIAERWVVSFKAGQKLKIRVEEAHQSPKEGTPCG